MRLIYVRLCCRRQRRTRTKDAQRSGQDAPRTHDVRKGCRLHVQTALRWGLSATDLFSCCAGSGAAVHSFYTGKISIRLPASVCRSARFTRVKQAQATGSHDEICGTSPRNWKLSIPCACSCDCFTRVNRALDHTAATVMLCDTWLFNEYVLRRKRNEWSSEGSPLFGIQIKFWRKGAAITRVKPRASARNGKVSIVLRWLHKFHRVNRLLALSFALALHVWTGLMCWYTGLY